jgi:hypothetical protein
MKGITKVQINLPAKEHQSLLVFDATEGFDDKVEERFNRLVQSVNGQNIKVDIATLLGNPKIVAKTTPAQVVPGARFGGNDEDEDEDEPTGDGSTFAAIEAAAKAAGYVQVIVTKGLR